MELLQAITYATRYIFKNGNLDWYYFTILFGIIWMFKRKCLYKYIRVYMISILLLLIMTVGNCLFAKVEISLLNSLLSCFKIFLCIMIMLWANESFLLINLKKFLYFVVGIHAIETTVALFFINNLLWRTNDLTNGFYETRLQLFYIEPSELSMCSALLLILILYLYETEGFSYSYIICMVVLSVDMYLSAGMCGILSLGFAIGIVAAYKVVNKAIVLKKYTGLVVCIAITIITILIVNYSNFPMIQRTRLILSGKFGADSSMMWRLQVPLKLICPILKNTSYMGVGLGNFNTDAVRLFLGKLFGWANWFPNSFLYFVAEGGLLAVVILFIGGGYLGFRALKSKRYSIMLLFCFIMIYQIPGGYFTNPLNWICYGIILSVSKEDINEGKTFGHNHCISI